MASAQLWKLDSSTRRLAKRRLVLQLCLSWRANGASIHSESKCAMVCHVLNLQNILVFLAVLLFHPSDWLKTSLLLPLLMLHKAAINLIKCFAPNVCIETERRPPRQQTKLGQNLLFHWIDKPSNRVRLQMSLHQSVFVWCTVVQLCSPDTHHLSKGNQNENHTSDTHKVDPPFSPRSATGSAPGWIPRLCSLQLDEFASGMRHRLRVLQSTNGAANQRRGVRSKGRTEKWSCSGLQQLSRSVGLHHLDLASGSVEERKKERKTEPSVKHEV